MSETQTRQRLAAILAADAVGYSRLMSADDHGTVAALDAARAIFRKHILASQGRVVDMAGDSVLAAFETAAGAVSAALATQTDLEAATAEVPSEQRLLFRIGVHLGDVIEKSDGTIYGDGINIAARLQALAPSGGIVISEAVRGSVKNRVGARYVDIGKQVVKNIAEPVHAYQLLRTTGEAFGMRSGIGRWRARIFAAVTMTMATVVGIGWYATHRTASPVDPVPRDAKSIAVLPFANISDDKQNAYFADGMHEEILTQLALLSDLKVVSRTSVMEYRDAKKNMRQIGSELGVRTLLEGSVRRAGDVVRVSVQLIDADSDKHLWAQSYERKLQDVFAIQNELATEITRALKVSLTPQDQLRLARKPTDNLEAYDLFLRYQELVNGSRGTVRFVSAVNERIALLETAVNLDPKFALAWARLGAEHARAYDYSIDRSAARLDKARRAIETAHALAPEDVEVQIDEAFFYQYGTNDTERATATLERVLKQAPHHVEARLQLGSLQRRELRWGQFAEQLEKVLSIDPRNVAALSSYVRLLWDFRQYDRALAAQQKLVSIRPEDIELQGRYQHIEYTKTGQWNSFDKWRATLPADAVNKYFRVWSLEIERAATHRDFDRLLELVSAPPKEVQFSEWTKVYADLDRALALLAAGNQSSARDIARSVLTEAAMKLHSRPDNPELLRISYLSHAILNEREAALTDHRHAYELAIASRDPFGASYIERDLADLYALMGDRDRALAEVSRQLRLPGSTPTSFLGDVTLFSLWDDPRFVALIRDPTSNAPMAWGESDPKTRTK